MPDEYPKWVTPHASHVVRRKDDADAPEHVSTPAWPQHHVNRVNGEVTVLVNDAAEEKRAKAPFKGKHVAKPKSTRRKK